MRSYVFETRGVHCMEHWLLKASINKAQPCKSKNIENILEAHDIDLPVTFIVSKWGCIHNFFVQMGW